MNILANDGISNSGVKALESAGFTVSTSTVAQENLIDEITRLENSEDLNKDKKIKNLEKKIYDWKCKF